jgi:hypothetical protein
MYFVVFVGFDAVWTRAVSPMFRGSCCLHLQSRVHTYHNHFDLKKKLFFRNFGKEAYFYEVPTAEEQDQFERGVTIEV